MNSCFFSIFFEWRDTENQQYAGDRQRVAKQEVLSDSNTKKVFINRATRNLN